MQVIALGGRGFVFARARVSSLLIAIVLALFIALFHVWLRVEVVQGEYEVSHLEQQIRRIKYENKELTVKVAQLSNPEHIEHIARSRLGLRAPGRSQVLFVGRK